VIAVSETNYLSATSTDRIRIGCNLVVTSRLISDGATFMAKRYYLTFSSDEHLNQLH